MNGRGGASYATMTDMERVTRLLLDHRKALYAYIWTILRNHHRAEDVFQDVCVVLIEHSCRLGGVQCFWAFARETARRRCLAEQRMLGRFPTLVSPDSLDKMDGSVDRVEDTTDDRCDALTRCLGSLPSRWRRIVYSHYWAGSSLVEIASDLKSTENCIAVTLNRIRSRLATCVSSRLHLEAAR